MVLKHMIQPVLQEEDVDLVTVRAEKEAEWQEWLRKEMKQSVIVFRRFLTVFS